MSNAATFNMTLNIGSDFTKAFKLKTPGTTNITNHTIVCKFKKSYQDTATTVTTTVTKTDASAGDFTISLTDTQTRALKPGTYVYDILSTVSSTTTALIRGKVQVLSGVSL